MKDRSDVHPKAPAGGGGPGAFRSVKPLGYNPELDSWWNPQPIGRGLAGVRIISSAASVSKVDVKSETDPAIEALDLSDTAKKAAYELKKKHPSVIFTSGRRDKQGQARAMASNVVHNRNWIKETYIASDARDACQKWVDENKNKKSVSEITIGIKGVLDGLTDDQLSHLSKHLSGDAFDVQPVEENAAEIKKTIRSLPGLSKFLDKEGGLVRWHAQF